MSKLETQKVTITGIRPLLMSNPQTVDITNYYATESRKINKALKAKRKAEDAELLIAESERQKKNEYCSSAYFDNELKKFYLPDTVVLACIKESAKSQKKGKDVDRAVQLTEDRIIIKGVPSVESLEDSYNNDAFRFGCPCKIPPKTGSLIWKVRCMMPTGWTSSFTLEYDGDVVAQKTLEDILNNAGAMVGIGGWRPKFGRFTVEFN